jgi:sulfur relay (sulfurtransferase) complex TusBCD TusD component (DsrE family)
MKKKQHTQPQVDALRDLQQARQLTEDSDTVLLMAVRAARRRGVTWQQIADVFGVSRQAVQERFGKVAR